MMNVKNIDDYGFVLKNYQNIEIDSSCLSLKIALIAYFSTYKYSEKMIAKYNSDNDFIPQDSSLKYCELHSQTIIHFHHYIELILKDILREKHPMLANTFDVNHEFMLKILNNSLNENEIRKVKTVEFGRTLDRFIYLLENEKIQPHGFDIFLERNNKGELKFNSEIRNSLNVLNRVRNKTMHRGLFNLKYEYLDELIGKNILYFVIQSVNHPLLSGKEFFWKYSELSCGIDPINEIINSFSGENNTYDLGKISMLKELGRASYSTKSRFDKAERKNDPLVKMGIHNILSEEENANINSAHYAVFHSEADLSRCPVCGFDTLVSYTWRDDHAFIHKIKCETCSFNLRNDIKNASEYGFNQIEDYWKEWEINDKAY